MRRASSARPATSPPCIYGHGTDPKHVALPAHQVGLLIRKANALLDLQIEGKSTLVLVKDVQKDPVRQIIEHIDLIVIKKGEKVQVEVPVHIEGEPFAGTIADLDAHTLLLEVEATHIPERVVVSVEGLEEGAQIHAKDVELPKGATLINEPDTLVVNVHTPQKVDLGEEAAAEAAEAEAAEGEAAEGEAAEEAPPSRRSSSTDGACGAASGYARSAGRRPFRVARRAPRRDARTERMTMGLFDFLRPREQKDDAVADNTWLVVGLGNPGAQYAGNRHNVGQMVADELASRIGATFKSHKTPSRVAEGFLRPGGPKLVIAKPNSYMNTSGGPVVGAREVLLDPRRAAHRRPRRARHPVRHRAPEAGRRARRPQRHPRRLEGDRRAAAFTRVRVGIGRPPGRQDAADFVLKDFSSTERAALPNLLSDAADAVEAVASEGIVAAQQRFHSPA